MCIPDAFLGQILGTLKPTEIACFEAVSNEMDILQANRRYLLRADALDHMPECGIRPGCSPGSGIKVGHIASALIGLIVHVLTL